MSIIQLTNQNFESEVTNSEKTVLIDFFANWCNPCKMLSPIVEEIAEEQPNAKVCKVNIDEQPELAESFDVMSIPTLIVIKNGKIVNKAVGVQPKAQLKAMLDV